MLERRDFITTYLNGQLRFDKPILIYWLQALSVSVFGLHEWSLRLPSALAASGWLWTIMAFVRPVRRRAASCAVTTQSSPTSHNTGVASTVLTASSTEAHT